MKDEISCGSVIIKEKQILIVQQNSGFYNFPKGHMKKGETQQQTAIREVKEETNLDIKISSNLKFSITYPIGNGFQKKVVYFIGYPITNSLKIEKGELKQAKWVNIEDVEKILNSEILKELWAKIKESIK